MKKYLPVILQNRAEVLSVSLLSILSALVGFLIPLSVSRVMNQELNVKTIITLFALVLLSAGLTILITAVRQHFIYKFNCKLAFQLYRKLFKVKYATLNEKGAAYYLGKILDAVSNYSDLIMTIVPSYVEVLVTALVSCAYLACTSIPLLLFVAVTALLRYYGFKAINKTLSKKCVTLSNVCGQTFENLLSVFDKIDYIKQCGRPDRLLGLLKDDNKRRYQATSDVNVFAGNASVILNMFVTNMRYIVYILLGIMMLAGKLTAAGFVSTAMVAGICFDSLRSLTQLSLDRKDADVSFAFIAEELDGEAEPDGTETVDSIDEIAFQDVCVRYGEHVLVDNVNVTFRKGDIVYLEAPTGTGKSSLAKGIPRMNELSGIRLGGKELSALSLESLRERVSYISQQNAIMNFDLAENVFLGRPHEKAVENKLAGIKFFSKFIRNGKIEDLSITGSGANLSGGDKQKIMLARLYAENPDVLILDEATSSMDEETAKAALAQITKDFSDRMILIISHTPFVAQFANRRCVIRDGKLLELPGSALESAAGACQFGKAVL